MKTSTKWFLGILLVLGIFVVGIFVVLSLLSTTILDEEYEKVSGKGDKIAIIELKGVILESEKIVKQFKKYRNDKSIKAILFRVDSPGGGVVASHEIYDEVRKTRDGGKPVVVSMGSVAASGGYYVACGANKIVANPGTLTGSIGVISQFLRLDPMLAKLGIEMNTIKSGKFKDVGTPFRDMTDEDKKYLQSLMDGVHHQFINIVSKERRIEAKELMKFVDGRVFIGVEALNYKLIDTLGTFEDAIKIAAEMANIKGEPALVREIKRKPFIERLLGSTELESIIGIKDKIFNHPILQYKLPNL